MALAREANPSLPERVQSARASSWGALLVLVLLAGLNAPRLRDELRFFVPGTLIDGHGSAPVPQDDAANPAVDAVLRAVAAHLPREAVCVIARDAWNRDYFRASYLLMPRRVWPAASLPHAEPLDVGAIMGAMQARHATCLLAPADYSVRGELMLVSRGVYTLYTLRAQGRTG